MTTRPSNAELQVLIDSEVRRRWDAIKPAEMTDSTRLVIDMWRPLVVSVAAGICGDVLDRLVPVP